MGSQAEFQTEEEGGEGSEKLRGEQGSFEPRRVISGILDKYHTYGRTTRRKKKITKKSEPCSVTCLTHLF